MLGHGHYMRCVIIGALAPTAPPLRWLRLSYATPIRRRNLLPGQRDAHKHCICVADVATVIKNDVRIA